MIILDTNVISERMRLDPALALVSWFERHPGAELYITTITVAEILYGVELLPEGKRRRGLLATAETMFTKVFPGRIFPFEVEAARAFSHVAAARRRLGRPMAEFDAQIAAIASVHNATLATRNTADFENCGIRVVNPWLD
jgi:predicted nucleic acid-binding protein